MKKDKTLVVLAAGNGSRFGGPKQITPVGPNEEYIMDYSIYNAIKNGFNHIVLIIKDNPDHIREVDKMKERIINSDIAKENNVRIDYAYQTNDAVIKDYTDEIVERSKPLGTTHAILCAKDLIDSDFMIINADDYYGKIVYKYASYFIDNTLDENTYGTINYPYSAVGSEEGSVKRGLTTYDENNNVLLIDESEISHQGEKLIAKSLITGKEREISSDASCAMNLLIFPINFLNFAYNEVKNEYSTLTEEERKTKEFLIPETLFRAKEKLNGTIKVINVPKDCMYAGMTYREELPIVSAAVIKENGLDIWNLGDRSESKGKNR